MAQRYGLPFETAKTDVRSLAKTEKLSIETAARLARHRFFDEAGRDTMRAMSRAVGSLLRK